MKMLFKLGAAAAFSLAAATAFAAKVDILDDCDASDPGWTPTGGCTLPDGEVTLAEFNALLTSVHSSAVVGHPAWTMSPTYLSLTVGEKFKVRNQGGRAHTFTEVAAYGGGFVPPLNVGMTPAPECTGALPIAPGMQRDVLVSSPGLHLFQCCIHPWMRAAIRFSPES